MIVWPSRSHTLPREHNFNYSQILKMPMSPYRVYSADYRNSGAPEGEP